MLRERLFNPAQKLLPLDAPRLYGRRHFFVAHRVGVAEGQVLKLAAHLAHPQPVRQRSVDVLSLAGDRLLTIRLQMLKGAHVVQPVSQLDQHNPDIGDHRQKHLAHVLGLAVLAVGKLDLVDLGDALNDVGHLVAKLYGNLLIRRRRVFDRVVQQPRGNGGGVHLHLRQNLGNLKRMNNVRLARGAHLALMMLDAELPCLADQRDIFIGAVGLNPAKQSLKALVDSVRSIG